MKKTIVITSIYPPSDAVISFSKIKDYNVIVVGDKKTPKNWVCNGVNYYSVEMQQGLGFKLEKILPYNHYCRKMVGYLKAIQDGADIIVDTDDDNIPNEDWVFPEFFGEFNTISENCGFVNIYQAFTKKKIWPRGLPLDLITKIFDFNSIAKKQSVNIGIWQGLADEDPDVDAIYRLTDNTPCYFDKNEPIVLGNGTLCPFNTQNTAIRKELFSLLYLPITVTFRFTDILRGFIAQPIMWKYGFRLGFIEANVVQKRNIHDFMKDFESEIPMYLSARNVVDIVKNSLRDKVSIHENLFLAYDSLVKENIVKEDELRGLEAWLNDIERL